MLTARKTFNRNRFVGLVCLALKFYQFLRVVDLFAQNFTQVAEFSLLPSDLWRTLAVSRVLASCLPVSERHGVAIIFHFVSSFPTTVNAPSPHVCSCDLQPKYPMGAEVLQICPCSSHLPGCFSGAVEKVPEGFSLRDRAWPNLGQWLGKSLTIQDSTGTTWMTIWWFYFVVCMFFGTRQLFWQIAEILGWTWKHNDHIQSLREEGIK